MTDLSLKTLLHPLETGTLAPPPVGARVLFLNAPAGFRVPSGWKAELTLVQDSRPVFLSLERGGKPVVPEAGGEGYDVALVLAGRHRGQNELWIAEALERLRAGGLLVAAGGKTEGAASLRKRIAGLAAIDGHASKNHGVVFWMRRDDAAATALREANPALEVEGFATAPGLFSHDRVDAGSKLLAECLPAELKGRAADFGAGWGYLSVELAQRAPGIASIDLFEASFAACAAARANLARLAPAPPCEVVWRDLTAESVERHYDVIVMNPPFHQGRAAEPSLGEAMIRAASAALKAGGRLLLVANRGLPYEAVLQSGFSRHGELRRDERFKVLWAVR